MKRHTNIVVLITFFLLATLMLVPYVTYAEDIRIAPLQDNVLAGHRIAFAGTGFYSHERIALWATDPDQAVIRGEYAEANGSGRAEIVFQVPTNALNGQWTITARGDESHVPVWASFTVYGGLPYSADFQAKVAPPVGPSGTIFAFAASGFDRWERVSYWFTNPNGKVYESFHRKAKANRNGRIDFSWTSPLDAIQGRWVVTMQGYDSGKARAIPFEIGWGSSQPAGTTPVAPAPTSPSISPCQPCMPNPPCLPCPSNQTQQVQQPQQPQQHIYGQRELVILPTYETLNTSGER